MAKNTNISWCHHTFNPWLGCQSVSPGCFNCYAETWAKRFGKVQWGPGAERVLTSDDNWRKPLQWNRAAQQAGERRRVFCASLADVFDNAAPEGARERLWRLIAATPHLDWLLLTKRPQNIEKMLPYHMGWRRGWDHVWLGVSTENQEEFDRRVPLLLNAPCPTRFLSVEPMLGPVNLARYGERQQHPLVANRIDWVICGGESGPGPRPMDLDWARDLRDQCAEFGIPFWFKQQSGLRPGHEPHLDGVEYHELPAMRGTERC